jgi:hypothetical protein
MIRVTSPRGSSRSIAPKRPRTISSKRLVSSRATATSREPRAFSRSASVPRTRPGASKSTIVPGKLRRRASQSERARPLRGRKPTNVNGRVAIPLATSPARTAEGPGTGTTGTSLSSAARTSREPGSESKGVPASETSAIVAPDSRHSSNRGMRRASLCAWSDTRRVTILKCAQRRPVRRVSSQAISVASRSTRSARGLRSSRLPMGVDTT